MSSAIWLVPALPLAGFLLIVLFGRRLGEPVAGVLATIMTASSFVVVALTWLEMTGLPEEERSRVFTLWSWVPVGGLHVDLALQSDTLSITMALFITGIGSLIHLYAIGYMHGDPKFPKFFMYLNLFVFSMLMLVLGENLLVTFLGWEGVGACSYFLISFWHTRDSAATAGKKAFVKAQPSDYLVTANGHTFYAEVKSSHDPVAFHHSNIQPYQMAASKRIQTSSGTSRRAARAVAMMSRRSSATAGLFAFGDER